MKNFLLAIILLFQGGILRADLVKPMFRALIVGDTITPETKIGLQRDVWRMQKSLEIISRKLGLPLLLSTLVDSNCTSDNIANWLRSLPKVSNDIVFFYYTGHGCRDGLSKPWPVLCIYPRNPPSRFFGGAAVVKYLKHTQQRLAVILFDCCNVGRDTHHITHIPKGSEVLMTDSDHLPGLHALFVDKKGIIVATACAPEEFSFDDNNGIPQGSTFSIGFIKALIKHCKKKNVSWQQIFSATKRYCIKDTKDEEYGPQHPMFFIE